MNKEKIAENLKNLRIKKGKTVVEVADALGISPSAWSMYESGERIPRDEIKIAIARYFKKTVSSIFFVD